MKTKAPSVVCKIKVDGRWVFAPIAKVNGKPDYLHVVVKGKKIPAGDSSFHLDYFENGKRKRPCIGRDAAAVKRALVTQQHVLELRRLGVETGDAPELERPAQGKALVAVLQEFTDRPPAGLSPPTYAGYRSILREFVAWAAAAHITHALQVDDKLMERYIRFLRDDRQLAPKTIGYKVHRLLAQLRRHGCHFALAPSSLPRVTRKELSIYTEETLRALFAACRPREYTLFQTFLLTGMREQEIAFLVDTDIDARRSAIRVTAKPEMGFTPKNRQERTVSVPRRLIELLEKHIGTRKGLVFGTGAVVIDGEERSRGGKPNGKMLLQLKRLARRAGLNCGHCRSTWQGKPVTCATHPVCGQFGLHKFRHTYATTMLRDRMDIASLQRQLGHTDLDSTKQYLHARGPDELQAEVEVSSLSRIV